MKTKTQIITIGINRGRPRCWIQSAIDGPLSALGSHFVIDSITSDTVKLKACDPDTKGSRKVTNKAGHCRPLIVDITGKALCEAGIQAGSRFIVSARGSIVTLNREA